MTANEMFMQSYNDIFHGTAISGYTVICSLESPLDLSSHSFHSLQLIATKSYFCQLHMCEICVCFHVRFFSLSLSSSYCCFSSFFFSHPSMFIYFVYIFCVCVCVCRSQTTHSSGRIIFTMNRFYLCVVCVCVLCILR